MKTMHPQLNHSPSPDWQTLGKIKLPVDANIVEAINVSLAEILTPLNLSTDFLNKILNSAQDSVMRAQQSDASKSFGHIHISIFAPNKQIQNGKTWGFFQTERIRNPSEDVDSHGHTIGYYLYTEGE